LCGARGPHEKGDVMAGLRQTPPGNNRLSNRLRPQAGASLCPFFIAAMLNSDMRAALCSRQPNGTRCPLMAARQLRREDDVLAAKFSKAKRWELMPTIG
jgi:hypothetical protein